MHSSSASQQIHRNVTRVAFNAYKQDQAPGRIQQQQCEQHGFSASGSCWAAPSQDSLASPLTSPLNNLRWVRFISQKIPTTAAK
ncbi:hypothetical protein XELAEV_18030189mg [Xenopus laevis]|uniref:Uncharacterized protein n=1 Tax=Xenopus laevis TaxID=8355 RepID=A0A974CUN1_XENLA|nr:hypothetical protein XELAEV_18030189mg [Xenopus laevis]